MALSAMVPWCDQTPSSEHSSLADLDVNFCVRNSKQQHINPDETQALLARARPEKRRTLLVPRASPKAAHGAVVFIVPSADRRFVNTSSAALPPPALPRPSSAAPSHYMMAVRYDSIPCAPLSLAPSRSTAISKSASSTSTKKRKRAVESKTERLPRPVVAARPYFNMPPSLPIVAPRSTTAKLQKESRASRRTATPTAAATAAQDNVYVYYDRRAAQKSTSTTSVPRPGNTQHQQQQQQQQVRQRKRARRRTVSESSALRGIDLEVAADFDDLDRESDETSFGSTAEAGTLGDEGEEEEGDDDTDPLDRRQRHRRSGGNSDDDEYLMGESDDDDDDNDHDAQDDSDDDVNYRGTLLSAFEQARQAARHKRRKRTTSNASNGSRGGRSVSFSSSGNNNSGSGGNKECASCGTRKTPVWRDAGATPLCNACGIRFKKSLARCRHCDYVPRGSEKLVPCSRCGQ